MRPERDRVQLGQHLFGADSLDRSTNVADSVQGAGRKQTAASIVDPGHGMEKYSMSIVNIWLFTREYGDLAGAGGVKDVAAQLSKSMARWNRRRVSVVLPMYGFIEPEQQGFVRLPDPDFPGDQLSYLVAMNYTDRERFERVWVWYKEIERVHVYLLEAGRFREKNGVYTYTREEYLRESWKVQGTGHFDYFAMNILLQKAGLDLAMLLGEKPEVIHCHDGHTAVVPAMMRECEGYRHYFRKTAAVVTIHNAGVGYHQEVSDLSFVQAVTGLPWRVVNDSCLEHSFDPFIAAGNYGKISTVSENYARELQETDSDYLTGWLGHQLKDNGVTIAGITNGIDPEDFDTTDAERMGIADSYDVRDSSDDLAGKRRCKEELIKEFSFFPEAGDEHRSGYLERDPDRPLFTFIGRLSDQKGVDILAEAAELFLADGKKAGILCLGSGVEHQEEALRNVAAKPENRGRFCFIRGYDPLLANRIYAAGDFFLIPSRYEPCGLTDYIALLFGSLPVVHHVGGLVKVEDGKTGFAYQGNSPENLALTMQRAFETYSDRETIRRMQRDGVVNIDREHTWKQVMKQYILLYKESVAGLSGQRLKKTGAASS